MSDRYTKNKKSPYYGKRGQLLNMTRPPPHSPARQVQYVCTFCPPPLSHSGPSFSHPHPHPHPCPVPIPCCCPWLSSVAHHGSCPHHQPSWVMLTYLTPCCVVLVFPVLTVLAIYAICAIIFAVLNPVTLTPAVCCLSPLSPCCHLCPCHCCQPCHCCHLPDPVHPWFVLGISCVKECWGG